MAEVATYGNASVRRIYGDFTTSQLNPWKNCPLNHSIIPIHQYAYTTGKNGSDGAMIIDAMDLLYTGRFTGFCLVSSDRDFTRLAARIREQCVTVYGFGERKTNNVFIAACNKFTYLDALHVDSVEYEHQLSAPHTTRSDAAIASAEAVKRPLDPTTITSGIRKAITKCRNYEDNYANLANVGHYLIKLSPDFTARNFGYYRLKGLMEASGIVELKLKPTTSGPPIALVRLKQGLQGQIRSL